MPFLVTRQSRGPAGVHTLKPFFTLSYTQPLHDSHLNTRFLNVEFIILKTDRSDQFNWEPRANPVQLKPPKPVKNRKTSQKSGLKQKLKKNGLMPGSVFKTMVELQANLTRNKVNKMVE